MTVVEVWENWLVFTPSVLQDFEKRLTIGDESIQSQREQSGSEHVEDSGMQAQRTGAPAATAASGPGSGFKAISGFSAVKAGVTDEPVDEDLDGEDIDGAEMPLQQGQDLDGEALDGYDLDGAPM
jgi:hypothetical protein